MAGSSNPNAEENWSFTITNTGGTGWSIGGFVTLGSSFFVFGPQNCNPATVPWSSGWTLEIGVAAPTGTVVVFGDTFTVEILS